MPRKVTFPPHLPHGALDPIVCILHAPEEVLFQKRFMSSPYPHAPAANFSPGTLQTGVPREPEDALSPAWGGRPPSAGPQMDWRLYPSFQGSGPPSMQPTEARPSPILEALIRWLFCPGSAEGEVPLPPDGGQPTRAAVLKLSLAHPSKASNVIITHIYKAPSHSLRGIPQGFTNATN